MNYYIESSDPWYIHHGALIGSLIVFGVLFLVFAWGMSM